MERIVIEGGVPLHGTVAISGAKNAVLPIIAAAVLSEGPCVLQESPWLADVEAMCDILAGLNVETAFDHGQLLVDASRLRGYEAPYEHTRRMRASFLVMGSLLARQGRAKIALPGGCAIGSRPIDLHLKGLEALGATVTIGQGYIDATASRLTGANIYLDFPSVGATENIMMAAVLADGLTVIENAAEEPEIVNLASFLNSMGAHIQGAGTKVVRIRGVRSLTPTRHPIIPDRVEAGSFMVAAAMTGGDVLVTNVIDGHIKSIIAKLRETGARVTVCDEGIRVQGDGVIQAADIKTLPYPGFPTDMQAQFMALLSRARGTSIISETVFENRMMHVPELKKMGADIRIEGNSAVIQGVEQLSGADVSATDLRAGAALVIAGLAAQGRSRVDEIYHIDRGYEDLTGKFAALGARIKRSN